MLSILGSTWGALARCRASLYETGWLRRHTLERPVISVGALSVGGAGKTPTTALLAGLLSEADCRPAILSLGYKRSGAAPLLVSRGDGRGPIVAVTEAGDEPFWLASALPAVPVAVASHREEAAQVVLSAMTAADVFLLDDGFQHLRVARDVNLLVVNPERPFWDDAPMPVGRLRESPAAATRADAFLIIGADAESTARLHERYPKPQRFELTRQAPRCWPLDERIPEALPTGGIGATEAGIDGPAFAFAGIARPERFFDDLEADGVVLKGRHAFPDHHEFRTRDLDEIVGLARECGATTLVTTEKDAVRLPREAVEIPLRIWGYRLQANEPERLVAWLKDRAGLSSLTDDA
jgi:tetraacyldisaccharide 4'-kinase